MSYNPIILITQGDPNGVGYEVILKALSHDLFPELCTPVILGSYEILTECRKQIGLEEFKINRIKKIEDVKEGVVNLLEADDSSIEIKQGHSTEAGDAAAYNSLQKAVEFLSAGKADALVTAPLSKSAFRFAEKQFAGHTEYLEERFGNHGDSLMIMASEHIRVALVTTHLSVKEIAGAVNEESIKRKAVIFNDSLKKDFGVRKPKIAVLSLNPHSGENGLLGKEEEEVIKPTINTLHNEGLLVFGPYPADGFFGTGMYSKFDGVLAMYHDQGLIPFKLLSGLGGVNFTAGLNIIRTSPDHGTAYNIAWKGDADSQSMRDALYAAIDIYRNRTNYAEISANPLKPVIRERQDKSENGERTDGGKTVNQTTVKEDKEPKGSIQMADEAILSSSEEN